MKCHHRWEQIQILHVCLHKATVTRLRSVINKVTANLVPGLCAIIDIETRKHYSRGRIRPLSGCFVAAVMCPPLITPQVS